MQTATTPLKEEVLSELQNFAMTREMGHSFAQARHGWVLEMEALDKMQEWWDTISADEQSEFLHVIDLPEPMDAILSHPDETFRKMAYLVWTIHSRVRSGQ